MRGNVYGFKEGAWWDSTLTSLNTPQQTPHTHMQSHTHKWNINQFTAQKYKGRQTGFLENSTWFWLFNYWWAEFRLLNDTALAVGERKDAGGERGGDKRDDIKRSNVEDGRENYGQRPSCHSSLLISWRVTVVEDTQPLRDVTIRQKLQSRHMLMDCSDLTCLNRDRKKETKASQGWQML